MEARDPSPELRRAGAGAKVPVGVHGVPRRGGAALRRARGPRGARRRRRPRSEAEGGARPIPRRLHQSLGLESEHPILFGSSLPDWFQNYNVSCRKIENVQC